MGLRPWQTAKEDEQMTQTTSESKKWVGVANTDDIGDGDIGVESQSFVENRGNIDFYYGRIQEFDVSWNKIIFSLSIEVQVATIFQKLVRNHVFEHLPAKVHV